MWAISLAAFLVGTVIGVYQESKVKPIFDKCFHHGHKHYKEKVLVHKV